MMMRDPVGTTLRIVATVSWVFVGACLIVIAVSGRTIGKPAWWAADADLPWGPIFIAVPFVAPVAAMIALWRAARVAPIVQLISVALLTAIAVIDIRATPAVAATQLIVAGCAALVTFASLAARPSRYRGRAGGVIPSPSTETGAAQ
jgi:hypothetical protein